MEEFLVKLFCIQHCTCSYAPEKSDACSRVNWLTSQKVRETATTTRTGGARADTAPNASPEMLIMLLKTANQTRSGSIRKQLQQVNQTSSMQNAEGR